MSRLRKNRKFYISPSDVGKMSSEIEGGITLCSAKSCWNNCPHKQSLEERISE